MLCNVKYEPKKSLDIHIPHAIYLLSSAEQSSICKKTYHTEGQCVRQL